MQFEITILCNAAINSDSSLAPFKPVQVVAESVQNSLVAISGTQRFGTNMDFDNSTAFFTDRTLCQIDGFWDCPTGCSYTEGKQPPYCTVTGNNTQICRRATAQPERTCITAGDRYEPHLEANYGDVCRNQQCRNDYTQRTPVGWEHNPKQYKRVVMCKRNNCPWGNIDAPHEHFAVLRNKDTYIQQTVHGLAPETQYAVAFSAARRVGHAGTLQVTVDGVELFKEHLHDAFKKHIVTFTAKHSNATVRFTNVVEIARSDRPTFVAGVTIGAASVTEKMDTKVVVTTIRQPSMPLGGGFRVIMGGRGTPVTSYYDYQRLRENIKQYIPSVIDCSTALYTSYPYEDGIQYMRSEFKVTFTKPAGQDQPLISVDANETLGTKFTVRVDPHLESSPSSRMHTPIPDDMLELAPNTLNFSTVAVRVNNINARCGDAYGAACSFEYSEHVTPAITQVDTASKSGTIKAGETLIITGSNLQYNNRGVDVAFGDAPCTVTAHSALRIECTVGHSAYGRYLPEVNVHGAGLATPCADSPECYKRLFEFVVTDVWPRVSSVRGGSVVTLSGSGFSLDLVREL